MASTNPYSLKELQKALMSIHQRRLMRQSEIADLSGIDQPTVSKAYNGVLLRKTPKTDALMQVAASLLRRPPVSNIIKNEIYNFYSNGGTDEELCAVISHGTMLISRRFRCRK